MGSLEDLAAAMLGAQAQKEIAAENPYYRLAPIASDVGNTAITLMAKDPKKNLKEGLLWGLGSGLLGGLTQGLGDNYQQKLTDRYSSALADSINGIEASGEGLSPNLFGSAKRQGTLFKLQSDLESAKDQRQTTLDMKKNFAKAFAEAPDDEARQNVLKAAEMFGLAPQNAPMAMPATEEAATPTETRGEDAQPSIFGIKPTNERRAELKQFYRKEGYTPTKAAEAANKDLEGEMTANKASFKKADELLAKAEDMINMADTVDSVLDQGLETGWGAETAHTARKVGSLVGVGNEKATLADMLNTIKSKSIPALRVPGVGAMSDPEMRLYIQGGPSLDKTPDANRQIAARMRAIGERSKEYVSFLQSVQEMGGTAVQADRLWAKYQKANPLWIKKGNEVIPNESATPWTAFDFNSAGATGGEGGSGASGNWGASDIPAVGGDFNGSKVVRVTKIK